MVNSSCFENFLDSSLTLGAPPPCPKTFRRLRGVCQKRMVGTLKLFEIPTGFDVQIDSKND